MSETSFYLSRLMLALTLAAAAPTLSGVQDEPHPRTLSPNRFRSGEETLRAFAPVSEATRFSIVKFNVDGETVALGAIVDY